MTEQLREIGTRLRALRDIMGYSIAYMAEKCGITEEAYKAYESGERDFSFSFLFNAANLLGVDVLDIMTGDSPKLSNCALVRAGQGFKVDRGYAYSYMHLAFTFRNKKADPFLVTIMPEDTPALHGHEGQEFQYVLNGEVQFKFGDTEYTLHPGDTVYFNASVPHATWALNGELAQFLAVVVK